jgi:hypothetical protein
MGCREMGGAGQTITAPSSWKRGFLDFPYRFQIGNSGSLIEEPSTPAPRIVNPKLVE